MSIISGLKKASLGGAEFLVESISTPNIGRKTVVHEFINSDSRFVEDLGKNSRVYNVSAIVTDTTWSAYKRKKDKLEKVLETAGIIKFVHPTYGVKQVVATVNSVSEDISSNLGIAKYSFTLLISDKNIFPKATSGNKSFINRLYDSLFITNEGALASAVDFAGKGLDLFNDGRDTIQGITSVINDSVATINGLTDEAAALVSDIQGFQASITSVMKTPAALAASFTNIYNGLSQVTNNFNDLFNVCLNIFDKVTTPIQKGLSSRIATLNSNRLALSTFNKVAALSIGYLSSTNIVYNNKNDLLIYQKRLDKAFLSIDPNIDSNVYYNLQNLRNQTRIYLDNLSLSLAGVVTQYTNVTSASTLSYSLYGTTDRAIEILTLNGIEDPAFISGNLKVLSGI
jgi:hypothetical protein